MRFLVRSLFLTAVLPLASVMAMATSAVAASESHPSADPGRSVALFSTDNQPGQGTQTLVAQAVDLIGTVKSFDENKGYGFITPDNGGPDAFVHYSEIKMPGMQMLTVGQKVKFDTRTGSRGVSAVNVRPLN